MRGLVFWVTVDLITDFSSLLVLRDNVKGSYEDVSLLNYILCMKRLYYLFMRRRVSTFLSTYIQFSDFWTSNRDICEVAISFFEDYQTLFF